MDNFSFMGFSLQTPETKVDFNSMVAPPITAMSEHADYAYRLEEQERNPRPLSLYEMETMQYPHSFQRQLMQTMFARPAPATSAAGPPPVTVFRRLTDTLKEMTSGIEK